MSGWLVKQMLTAMYQAYPYFCDRDNIVYNYLCIACVNGNLIQFLLDLYDWMKCVELEHQLAIEGDRCMG